MSFHGHVDRSVPTFYNIEDSSLSKLCAVSMKTMARLYAQGIHDRPAMRNTRVMVVMAVLAG